MKVFETKDFIKEHEVESKLVNMISVVKQVFSNQSIRLSTNSSPNVTQ